MEFPNCLHLSEKFSWNAVSPFWLLTLLIPDFPLISVRRIEIILDCKTGKDLRGQIFEV